MSRGPFQLKFDDLPQVLPIFPLTGALLLPGGRLPLNIFEPRYLEMVDRALAEHRMIGMIQPKEESEDQGSAPVYPVGCAGRISQFGESEDGRYMIMLNGVIRFTIAEELAPKSYRQVRADYTSYKPDLEESHCNVDRARLLGALKSYFEAEDIESDWTLIDQTDDGRLVTALSMLCPLDPSEKQLLLEATTQDERADRLITVLEMAMAGNGIGQVRH